MKRINIRNKRFEVRFAAFFLSINEVRRQLRKPEAPELAGFIRFQFRAHGGQLYKRISLESSLNLII